MHLPGFGRAFVGAIEGGAGQRRNFLTTVQLCYTILSTCAPLMRAAQGAAIRYRRMRAAGKGFALQPQTVGVDEDLGDVQKSGGVSYRVSGHRR